MTGIKISHRPVSNRKVSLESQKDHDHRHGDDANKINGRPRLALGHDDVLFVPQRIVVLQRYFQHDIFSAEKRQWDGAIFRGVVALCDGAVGQVVNGLFQIKFHSDVVGLAFVFAVEYEEVKSVFGDSEIFVFNKKKS